MFLMFIGLNVQGCENVSAENATSQPDHLLSSSESSPSLLLHAGPQCGRSTRTSPSPSSSPSSSRCSSSSTTGPCTTSWPAPLLSSAGEPDSDSQPGAGAPRLAEQRDWSCTRAVDAFRFRPRTLQSEACGCSSVGAPFYFLLFQQSLN